MNFVYPQAADLIQIAQDKMPNLTQDRPIFDILPIRSVDNHLLLWEQLDNFVGLQQVRGLDGSPPRVTKVGLKRYSVEPGTYGEFIEIDEKEMTNRRQVGSFNQVIDISDLVMMTQDQLLNRRLDRIEVIGWNILQGTFSVSGPNGAIMHTDTYSPQTFTAGTTWATAASATPLADFRSIQLLHLGHSVRFDSQATAFMNRVTWNRLISNSNNADLYGRRTAGLGIINNVQDFNKLAAGDDLPQIQIYDGSYLDDSGTAQRFIPTGTVIVVGKRPAGQTIGEFRMTRNMVNGGAPGPYMKVISRIENQIPPTVEVHDGFNGGPVIYYPSAIVVMSV